MQYLVNGRRIVPLLFVVPCLYQQDVLFVKTVVIVFVNDESQTLITAISEIEQQHTFMLGCR